MGFTMTSYSSLKEQFAEQVVALRGKHSASSIDKFHQPRRYQVQFLTSAIALLDGSEKLKEGEKARILSGLMIIIKKEISDSYEQSYFRWFSSEDNSLFKTSLDTMIGVSVENILDPNSEARMVNQAMKFVTSSIFPAGDSTQKLIKDHPFFKIDGFKARAFCHRGLELDKVVRTAVFDDAFDTMEKEIADELEAERRAKSGGSSYLGSFFSSSSSSPSKKPAAVTIDADDPLVLDPNASSSSHP